MVAATALAEVGSKTEVTHIVLCHLCLLQESCRDVAHDVVIAVEVTLGICLIVGVFIAGRGGRDACFLVLVLEIVVIEHSQFIVVLV